MTDYPYDMDIKQYIRQSYFFSLFRETGVWFDERSRFFKEAKARFMEDQPSHGSYHDYVKAFNKHRVTYSEYMNSYEFWRLSEVDRDEFISTSEVQCVYRKIGDPAVRNIFHNKVSFLRTFDRFINRHWALVRDLDLIEFKSMLSQFDCIAKPIDGTRGEGITKIHAADVKDWPALFKRFYTDNILLEQCVQSCEEFSSFHSSSLNTIRVVTISNGNKFEVFGALFRMGAHGSVIDNTHAGGIYAPINVKTGEIDVDAIDANNNHYEFHPDSHLRIRGFRIPYWERIVNACREAALVIPNIHFAGWDVCLTTDYSVEIIEGHHAPDFDGGMQAPLKIGVKKRFQKTVKEIIGKDPLQLISIWRY